MNEIEKWLNGRIGLNFRSGLERMQRAVDLLGNPERAYPVIHVTGTNGFYAEFICRSREKSSQLYIATYD